MAGRANPFGEDSKEQGLDLSGFKSKKPPAKVNPAEIRKIAEKAAFPSREPASAPPVPENSERRLHRTGRNIQFSCKVTQGVEDEIYALTDELSRRMEKQIPGARCTVGMTVERMVAALRRELAETDS